MVLTAFDILNKLHNSETATARMINKLNARFNSGMGTSPAVYDITP